MQLHAHFIAGAALGVVVATLPAHAFDGTRKSSFRWSASMNVEEVLDFNVYLQSTTPLANLFVDKTATIAPARSDSIAFVARQFQQMSSSGRGAFGDRNFDLAWRHIFSPDISGALMLHAYNTEFLRPAMRDDWVDTARLQAAWTLTEGWTLGSSILLEEGARDIPDMPGREYTRQACSVALRTRF